jgi:hypothetical protein
LVKKPTKLGVNLDSPILILEGELTGGKKKPLPVDRERFLVIYSIRVVLIS